MCDFPPNAFLNVSPGEVPIEMANNRLHQLVWEECASVRQSWEGNVQHKMKVVESQIYKLAADRKYFEDSFNGLRRFKWVADNGGKKNRKHSFEYRDGMRIT